MTAHGLNRSSTPTQCRSPNTPNSQQLFQTVWYAPVLRAQAPRAIRRDSVTHAGVRHKDDANKENFNGHCTRRCANECSAERHEGPRVRARESLRKRKSNDIRSSARTPDCRSLQKWCERVSTPFGARNNMVTPRRHGEAGGKTDRGLPRTAAPLMPPVRLGPGGLTTVADSPGSTTRGRREKGEGKCCVQRRQG